MQKKLLLGREREKGKRMTETGNLPHVTNPSLLTTPGFLPSTFIDNIKHEYTANDLHEDKFVCFILLPYVALYDAWNPPADIV